MGDRDFLLTLRWGADPGECGCALSAAAALLQDFDAFIYYPADAPNAKAPILKEIEDLEKSIRGHVKEVKQKWPDQKIE